MTELTNAQLNERIDGMAAWATGIETKLTQIQERLAPDVARADSIVSEMMNLDSVQVSRAGEMATLERELADQRSDIAEQKERIKEIGAEMLMYAKGSNAEKRKGEAATALKKNNEYQALKDALSINERGKLVKQAHYDTAEREYKRLGEQLRNLRVRLEHWTARAKLSIGE